MIIKLWQGESGALVRECATRGATALTDQRVRTKGSGFPGLNLGKKAAFMWRFTKQIPFNCSLLDVLRFFGLFFVVVVLPPPPLQAAFLSVEPPTRMIGTPA